MTDVYPAREAPIPGVSGRSISELAEYYGHTDVHYVQARTDLPDFVSGLVKQGDVVLSIGAGDIWRFGEPFVTKLEAGSREE